MKSSWGWSRQRNLGSGVFGPRWLRPLAMMVPWLTVLLLLEMFHLIGGTLVSAQGVAFELPEGEAVDGELGELVALVTPSAKDTLVFFDDARFSMSDRESLAAFGEQLAERAKKADRKSLVVLADRRVTGEELMRLAAVARWSGVPKILLSTKEKEGLRE